MARYASRLERLITGTNTSELTAGPDVDPNHAPCCTISERHQMGCISGSVCPRSHRGSRSGGKHLRNLRSRGVVVHVVRVSKSCFRESKSPGAYAARAKLGVVVPTERESKSRV
jgi:hypothetical protein